MTTVNSKTLLLCLWPACSSYQSTACSLLKEHGFTITDRRELFLTFPQFNQLVRDTYRAEAWMTIPGLLRKSTWCYQKNSPVVLFLVSGGSPQQLVCAKEAFRKKTKRKKHSLHTTETPEDTAFLWNTYAGTSPDFSYAASLSKSPKWLFFKYYYKLRVTFLSLIGQIET